MTDAQQPPTPELITVDGTPTMVVRGVVPMSELPSFFDRSFSALGEELGRLGTEPAGPPFSYNVRLPTDTSDLEVGFPVREPVEPTGDVVPSSLPGGRVATVLYQGGYDGLVQAWTRLHEWVAQQGLGVTSGSWEVYLNEPTPDGDPDANRTQLYQPVTDV
ncbi:GyrI-like domain-containing protein [Sanguibacter suaedae]|uniref:GyrI-like domain-containing protein n=1 Tax=Sanguibacter suaedae TaxID=2795737 RepID=A0A934MA14_9MICO|nr:GyrI-like domain-containing protein [Sanguibacter suaedae]MBI9113756.1 GyrI-like domain-containing protein [Sanguibacter suaedae]